MVTLPGNVVVTLKLNICQFFMETINYFGHVKRPGREETALRTIYGICGLQEHTNLLRIRNFFDLKLCIVFRRFVSNFRQTAPLDKKLRENHPKTFGFMNDKETQSMNAC